MKSISMKVTILVIMLICNRGFAQEPEQEKFKPYGSPIIKVFANLHTGVFQDVNLAGFEIRRAYLGYSYNLSEKLYAQIKIDIGSPDDISEFSRIRRYAYFKNAFLQYTNWGFVFQAGLIDMQHFITQEKFWGYRYIAKSYSDRYRFGPKADIGVDAVYHFKEVFSIDVNLVNGEGYTNIQRDNTFKGGLGIDLYPVKGLTVRVYGDIMSKSNNEITLATFAGYKFKKLFRIAVEYNHKFNDDYVLNQDYYGYSLYSTIIINPKFEVFWRYDWLNSNIIEGNNKPWHLARDGSSIITGVQYQPHKRVKIALDYQDWVPYVKNVPSSSFIFINLEFKY